MLLSGRKSSRKNSRTPAAKSTQSAQKLTKSATPAVKGKQTPVVKKDNLSSRKQVRIIKVEPTDKKQSEIVTPVRSSGRSRRNVSTPNWADILSGKKSFKSDGAVLMKATKTSEDESNETEDELEDMYSVEEMVEKTVDDVTVKPSKNKPGKTDGTGSQDEREEMEIAGNENEAPQNIENNLDKEESPSKEASRETKSDKFVCSHCDKTYTSQFLFDQHIKISHSKVEKAEDDGDQEKELSDYDKDDDFADDIHDEDYNFEGKDEIDEDDGDYSEREESYMMLDVKNKTDKKSKQKVISTQTSSKLMPVVIGSKPVCKLCGTQFLSMANLRRHLLLHSDKMYECPYCARIMKRKDYVIGHIKKCHKEIDLDVTPIDFSKYTHTLSDATQDEVSRTTEDGSDDTDAEPKPAKMPVITGVGKKVCPECTKLFDTQADLEQHMILVHEKDLKDAAYTCQACKKQFKTLVSYQVHKLSHRKKDFVCPHCDKKFKTNSQLQVHKRRDHQIQYGTLMYFGFLMNNDRITCEICSADFDTMSDYLDHRTEHVVFEHLCRECGNGFDTEKDLEHHKETGCADQNYHLPCGMCNAKFYMFDTRRKHIMTYHPKKSDSENYCHHCGKTFDTIDELKDHFKVHNKEKIFVCEACEKRFFEKRILLDHRELHKSSKNFQCHICMKFYISSRSLQRHIKLHLSKSTKGCKHCNEKFATQDDLTRHMKQEHMIDEKQIKDRDGVSCPKCERKFASSIKLAKHMQLHSDNPESSYLCVHCEKVFDSNEIPLWKHMEVEHPGVTENSKSEKKNYVCDTCGFTTVIKQRIDRHMETHNPNKEFECKFCGKHYQTTSSLMTHLITHRGKVKKGAKPQPKCTWPGCIKQFLKHSIYKRHLISHIYRIKVGKDLCECGQCPYSVTQGKKYLVSGVVSDISAVGFVDQEGKSHLASHIKKKVAADGSTSLIEVSVNTGVPVGDNYQSMEVLHEAIAQIEDIEKSNENSNEAEGNKEDGEVNSRIVDGVEGKESTIENSDTSLNPESMLNKGDKINVNAMIDACVMSSTEGNTETGTQSCSVATAGEVVLEFPAAETEVTGVDNQEAISAEAEKEQNNTPDGNAPNVSEVGTQIVDIEDENLAETLAVFQEAESKEPSSLPSGEKGYECGVCELMFMHKCQVLHHLESVHQKFPHCDVCGKVMIDQKNLGDHKLIHDELRRFACNECGRKFRTKQCLRQHSYIHAEVKPFQCEHCGHGFTQRGFYEEHLRRHMGVKPYKCAVCSKSFVAKNMLKIHMYSHTGNRPYQCQYCPKTFSENYHLQNHIRNHVDNRPFQCAVCQKAFCVKPKLIRHMTAVHGIEKETLSNYYPTKIGKGIGYRDKTKSGFKEPRKTQVVYIDAQGNIVRQEMKTDQELELTENQALENEIKIEKGDLGKQERMTNLSEVQLEVVTQRDADGNIQTIVPTQFLPEPLISLPEETEEDSVVYQEIQADAAATENIELDGQSYAIVSGKDFCYIQ